MNLNIKKILFCFIIISFVLTPILSIHAQEETNSALKEARDGLIKSASEASLTDETGTIAAEPQDIIARLIGYILAFIGIILLMNIIFAGYGWMNSGGNEEAIKKAKDKIKSSIIGLIIIVAAYILVDLIFITLNELITPPVTS